jgi:hypothetical protein
VVSFIVVNFSLCVHFPNPIHDWKHCWKQFSENRVNPVITLFSISLSSTNWKLCMGLLALGKWNSDTQPHEISMMDVPPSNLFFGIKITLPKVLCGKVYCCNVKSISVVKAFHDCTAVNISKLVGRILRWSVLERKIIVMANFYCVKISFHCSFCFLDLTFSLSSFPETGLLHQSFLSQLLSELAQMVMFLTCACKMTGSNLVQYASYWISYFSCFSSVSPATCQNDASN